MTDDKKQKRIGPDVIPRRVHKSLFYDGPAFLFFNNHPEAAEHVIRIILNRKDLHVLSSVGQHVISKYDTHDIRCDVLAEDDNGTQYDIEIQQIDSDNLLKRADYYGAMMKVDALKKNEDYEQNREVYVIFILKKGNVWCQNKHVRSFYMCDDNKIDMHIGTRIYFVNGELKDDTEIGKLMQSFHCENADEMQDKFVAQRYREITNILDQEDEMDDYDRTIYELGLKRGAEQGRISGKADGIVEGKAEGEAKIVQYMLRTNKSISETAILVGLTEDVVKKYAEMKLD